MYHDQLILAFDFNFDPNVGVDFIVLVRVLVPVLVLVRVLVLALVHVLALVPAT